MQGYFHRWLTTKIETDLPTLAAALAPEHCYVVGLVEDEYPLARNITVYGLQTCMEKLEAAK
jgi:hypothetical protein